MLQYYNLLQLGKKKIKKLALHQKTFTRDRLKNLQPI